MASRTDAEFEGASSIMVMSTFLGVETGLASVARDGRRIHSLAFKLTTFTCKCRLVVVVVVKTLFLLFRLYLFYLKGKIIRIYLVTDQ